MKKYYVCWGDFGNVYSLRWADAGAEVPVGYEQITRKEAERLARAERRRRKEDHAFSGYADDVIYPFPPCSEADNPGLYWRWREAVEDARWMTPGLVVEI